MAGVGTTLHASAAELAAGLADVSAAPSDVGRVELIVARPARGERLLLEEAALDAVQGLVGDCWRTRGSSRTPDGAADPLAQVTVMNARATALVARTRDRWALSGDQLHLDYDISFDNLLAGDRLRIGACVIEVTPKVHTGCAKFRDRFGVDAMRFVNSPAGRAARARGLNAIVVTGGTVKLGDAVTKLLPSA
jgi:hypothetical protein